MTKAFFLLAPGLLSTAFFTAHWILSRRRAPSAQHMNWSQLVNYGKDLGIKARRFESYDSFRLRVVMHLRSAPWRDITWTPTPERWED